MLGTSPSPSHAQGGTKGSQKQEDNGPLKSKTSETPDAKKNGFVRPVAVANIFRPVTEDEVATKKPTLPEKRRFSSLVGDLTPCGDSKSVISSEEFARRRESWTTRSEVPFGQNLLKKTPRSKTSPSRDKIEPVCTAESSKDSNAADQKPKCSPVVNGCISNAELTANGPSQGPLKGPTQSDTPHTVKHERRERVKCEVSQAVTKEFVRNECTVSVKTECGPSAKQDARGSSGSVQTQSSVKELAEMKEVSVKKSEASSVEIKVNKGYHISKVISNFRASEVVNPPQIKDKAAESPKVYGVQKAPATAPSTKVPGTEKVQVVSEANGFVSKNSSVVEPGLKKERDTLHRAKQQVITDNTDKTEGKYPSTDNSVLTNSNVSSNARIRVYGVGKNRSEKSESVIADVEKDCGKLKETSTLKQAITLVDKTSSRNEKADELQSSLKKSKVYGLGKREVGSKKNVEEQCTSAIPNEVPPVEKRSAATDPVINDGNDHQLRSSKQNLSAEKSSEDNSRASIEDSRLNDTKTKQNKGLATGNSRILSNNENVHPPLNKNEDIKVQKPSEVPTALLSKTSDPQNTTLTAENKIEDLPKNVRLGRRTSDLIASKIQNILSKTNATKEPVILPLQSRVKPANELEKDTSGKSSKLEGDSRTHANLETSKLTENKTTEPSKAPETKGNTCVKPVNKTAGTSTASELGQSQKVIKSSEEQSGNKSLSVNKASTVVGRIDPVANSTDHVVKAQPSPASSATGVPKQSQQVQKVVAETTIKEIAPGKNKIGVDKASSVVKKIDSILNACEQIVNSQLSSVTDAQDISKENQQVKKIITETTTGDTVTVKSKKDVNKPSCAAEKSDSVSKSSSQIVEPQLSSGSPAGNLSKENQQVKKVVKESSSEKDKESTSVTESTKKDIASSSVKTKDRSEPNIVKQGEIVGSKNIDTKPTKVLDETLLISKDKNAIVNKPNIEQSTPVSTSASAAVKEVTDIKAVDALKLKCTSICEKTTAPVPGDTQPVSMFDSGSKCQKGLTESEPSDSPKKSTENESLFSGNVSVKPKLSFLSPQTSATTTQKTMSLSCGSSLSSEFSKTIKTSGLSSEDTKSKGYISNSYDSFRSLNNFDSAGCLKGSSGYMTSGSNFDVTSSVLSSSDIMQSFKTSRDGSESSINAPPRPPERKRSSVLKDSPLPPPMPSHASASSITRTGSLKRFEDSKLSTERPFAVLRSPSHSCVPTHRYSYTEMLSKVCSYGIVPSNSTASLPGKYNKHNSFGSLSQVSELWSDLSQEQSSAAHASDILEAETTERLRLEKEVQDLQSRYSHVQQKSDKMEMEMMEAKVYRSGGVNGDLSEDEDGEGNNSIYKQKYERAVRDMEMMKRRIQQQHEEEVEQNLLNKKASDKKLAEALEDVEEERQVANQWKRKAQKLSSELQDLRLMLEEQMSRNGELEKKQRRFDSELSTCQEEIKKERLLREKVVRERDQVLQEKYSLEQELHSTRLDMDMQHEKITQLNRELDELTLSSKGEEEVTQLKRAKQELERKTRDQEEELEELAGQVQMLEQSKLRLEMSLEKLRQEHRRESSVREEEIEELRASFSKKIKNLEAQIETEQEERHQLVKQKHELERRVIELTDQPPPQDPEIERRLRRDLKRTRALLRDAQSMLEHMRDGQGNKSAIRQLKNQLEDAEFAKCAAIKAKQSAEMELQEVQSQLEEVSRTKNEAETRCLQLSREKSAIQTQLEEMEEEMSEVMKKYKSAVAQMSIDAKTISEQNQQISELESERHALKEQLSEVSTKFEHLSGQSEDAHKVHRLDAKVRDLESKLDLEQTTRSRQEHQITRLKEQIDRMQEECDNLRNKDLQAQEGIRRFQRQIRDLREDYASLQQKESDAYRKQHELELALEAAESDLKITKNDLRLACQRIEELKNALEDDLDSGTDVPDDSGSDSDSSLEMSVLRHSLTPIQRCDSASSDLSFGGRRSITPSLGPEFSAVYRAILRQRSMDFLT